MGDAFGSLICDCHRQMDAAVHAIVDDGVGAIVYAKPERPDPMVCTHDEPLDTTLAAGVLRACGLRHLRLTPGSAHLSAELEERGLQVAASRDTPLADIRISDRLLKRAELNARGWDAGPLMRSGKIGSALIEAKARLDPLELYEQPVKLDHVRIVSAGWLFALPWFRRFDGYTMWNLIVLRRPELVADGDLVCHELCHVWQMQHHPIRMPLSYLRLGYAANPYEAQARRAAVSVAET